MFAKIANRFRRRLPAEKTPVYQPTTIFLNCEDKAVLAQLREIAGHLRRGELPPGELAYMYPLEPDGSGYIATPHQCVIVNLDWWGMTAFCPKLLFKMGDEVTAE